MENRDSLDVLKTILNFKENCEKAIEKMTNEEIKHFVTNFILTQKELNELYRN